MKEVLISFVGMNDFNKSKDGAVLTIFKKLKFDEVHLLWNPSEYNNFYEIGKYVKSEIEKRKFSKKVLLHSFDCNDVTDHNEIYPKLLSFCKSLDSKSVKFTAGIASGTPSMQACWILMAESGDFPLKLIRSDDPKFGKSIVREVKLGTALPRILRIQNENRRLKKILLPIVKMNISKAELKIGNEAISLSPVEFSYYRFFLERIIQDQSYLRIDIDTVPDEFYISVLKYHRESYSQADSNRMLTEKNKWIASSNFRSNISKLNKKIDLVLKDPVTSKYYYVEGTGQRFRKSYGINLPKDKIKIFV